MFLDIVSDPPPCLVWLPLMHRLANVENGRWKCTRAHFNMMRLVFERFKNHRILTAEYRELFFLSGFVFFSQSTIPSRVPTAVATV